MAKKKTYREHLFDAGKYSAPSVSAGVLLTTIILSRVDNLFKIPEERQLASLVIMAIVTFSTNIAMVVWKKKVQPLLG